MLSKIRQFGATVIEAANQIGLSKHSGAGCVIQPRGSPSRGLVTSPPPKLTVEPSGAATSPTRIRSGGIQLVRGNGQATVLVRPVGLTMTMHLPRASRRPVVTASRESGPAAYRASEGTGCTHPRTRADTAAKHARRLIREDLKTQSAHEVAGHEGEVEAFAGSGPSVAPAWRIP